METEKTEHDIQHLFELIRDIKFAMLTTLDDEGCLRSRPMANQQREQFDGTLWFFTRASSHKVEEVDRQQQVNLSFSNPEKQNYVSISGTAELVRDRAIADQLWTTPMKAWFPKGTEDPDLALLKVEVSKAEYWDSPSSAVVHLFGVAKAVLTGEAAKGGENKKLNFG